MTTIPVQAVCNTILMKSFEEKITVTQMKLQKLLYFVFKDYLQKTDEALFSEQFETWPYGPVLPSVYNEFSSFGSDRITKLAKNADGSATIVSSEGAPSVMESINLIWSKYKRQNGIQLSNITHRPGSAWYKAHNKNELFLSNDDIKEDHVE